MWESKVNYLIEIAIPPKKYSHEWDGDFLKEKTSEIFKIDIPVSNWFDEEGIDEEDLKYRIEQVQYLGEELFKRGIPIILPTGGHGVYIDAQKFYPHIPQKEFPGQALVIELYKTAGVRGVELGSCAFSKKDKELITNYFLLTGDLRLI